MSRLNLTFLYIGLLSFISYAQFELEEAFPNLSFDLPVDFQNADDGSNRVFVVEQRGVITVFENSSEVPSVKTFLDITGKVRSGGERGLLGLAFHPDYETNGFFYVNYTRENPNLQSVVSRFSVSPDPDSADDESEQILLTLNQPYTNHNGGQVAFGPDGYLYISFGDGGSSGDPQNNAQNLSSLLGKILRIDVDTITAGLNYGIPPDNPFLPSLSARPEVFAYGLRNPWRFSFDNSGKLWCADVGQNAWEEIDTIQSGGNYGWKIMEGMHCYSPSSGCDTSGLILPIYEYGRSSGGSVTGGFVYESLTVPELTGRYIFADYVSRRIWSLGYYGINPDEPIVELLLTAQAGISSFGVDESDELYICSFDGKIYKFKETVTDVDDEEIYLKDYALLQNYPNPFNPSTIIKYNLPERSRIRIEIINLEGRIIATLADAVEAAGIHQLNWNAAGNSSGIYYVKMNAESVSSGRIFQKTMKIVFIK